MEIDRVALEEWQKQQPLSILALDPADRAVLRIAGKSNDSVLAALNSVGDRGRRSHFPLATHTTEPLGIQMVVHKNNEIKSGSYSYLTRKR
jgi:hypothetical protein